MTTYIIIIALLIIILLYWKNKPINSHKLPQKVELNELELGGDGGNEKIKELRKGHKLILKRVLKVDYHLVIILNTNGKDLSKIKKVVISWSGWEQRIFNFSYLVTDERVTIENDNLIIDLGSFNNCNGSKNFLKRTYHSDIIRFDLLNYLPERDDFEWEKDTEFQSVFIPRYSKSELKKFKKGVHFADS